MKQDARLIGRVVVLMAVGLFLCPGTVFAALTGAESAEVVFTTLADRFLRQQFSFGATNIPIAPTNEYAPAVHRLLQVAANIYDATRSDPFPSVFRPLFTRTLTFDGGQFITNVFLTGFTNDNRRSTLPAWLAENRQYGIPLIIGAKKGLPNFNEYTLRTDFQLTRKLEFVRPDTNSRPNQTNQMYILGISNLFAVEAWNSYATNCPRPLALEVSDVATVRITNDAGLSVTLPLIYAASISNLPANSWGGGAFKLPLYQQEVLIPPSRYLFIARAFEPVGTNFFFTETEDMIGFPVPDWQFSISNQLLYVLTDTSSDSIVDFVLSSALNTSGNIDLMLRSTHQRIGTAEQPIITAMWNTNRADGSQNLWVPTMGIVKQIDVAVGDEPVSETTWRNYIDPWARSMDKERMIMSFRKFMDPTAPVWGPYATNLAYTTSLRIQSPFNPTRKLIQTTTWQANDPLVHTHVGDLLIFPTNSIYEPIVPPITPVPTNMSLATVGHLNRRYAPWGGNPEMVDPMNPSVDYNAYNSAVKDPGVRSSDDWNFPAGQPLSVSWLGRVHRGTPWQTIYLKPDIASADTWRLQSADYLWYPTNGNPNLKYVRTHPTNDWALVRMMFSLLNTNPPERLVSINDFRSSAWASVWEGVTVLSNNVSDRALLDVAVRTNSTIPFAPLVMSSNSPQAATLNDALNRARAARTGNRFRDLADFLTVPELSMFSPWLNTAPDPLSGKPLQRWFGLTDTAYEAIPSQIFAQLREEDVWGTTTCGGGSMQVQFAAWPGYSCDVEASSDLTNWTSLQGAFSVSNQLITVDTPVTPGSGPRFFRAKLSPVSP